MLARLPKDEDGNEAFELVFTNAARFRTAFQGSTNESMKRLLKAATSKKKPCIVIIDEIDGTTAKLGPHNSTQEDNRANKALIDMLDLVRHNRRIFFIATSNFPEKMDSAVLRRFRHLRYLFQPIQDVKQSWKIISKNMALLITMKTITPYHQHFLKRS